MKNKHYIAIAIIMTLCVLTLFSGISLSGVIGTKHDLRVGGGSNFQFDFPASTGAINEQVCVFCHTPHGASSGIKPSTILNASGTGDKVGGQRPMLLWNRRLPTTTGASKYVPYTSSSMSTPGSEIRAYSLLCLSCHDGVSAMNVLLNYPESWNEQLEDTFGVGNTMSQIFNADNPFGWGPNIGGRNSTNDPINLSNDHPISFDYTTAHPDISLGGLNSPDNTQGYVSDTRVKLFPNPTNMSQKSSLECSTCHDVHNEAIAPFLVMPNENSGLCRVCHKK